MIRFVDLREEHLKTVMEWRVKPEVSQYMATDVVYDMEAQYQWFNRVSKDDTFRYWVVFYQDIPIGLINLAAINRTHRHCTLGYNIGELAYRQLGALIPPYLYNHIFNDMKFRKIYGEVMAENKKVLQMHALHGFRQVGTFRDHYFKKDQFHDVVVIELLAESWLKKKAFQRYTATFS